MSRVFCPHELEPLDTRQPLHTVHNLVKLGETALNYLTYGSDVMILPGSLDRFYLVQLPLTGSALVTSGNESVESNPCSAVILNPDERIRMRWSGESGQLLLWIPRRSIERRLTEILGEAPKQPLRFDVELRQSAGMTSAWCTMLKDLARNIDENGIDWLRFRPAVSSLEDCLIRGLIYQQPHNYSERLLKPALPAHSRQLQRALDYIDCSALVTVADIAQHAHLSVRALEEGFRKHYGTTPMLYLRGKRLDQARSAIVANALAGSPETITEIAFRHGFNHLGRFSAYYRERIGESPSDTARSAVLSA
ncbi:MAG TPA: AraC family transcriptional regulator [Aromatoleum sp.]|uniref:AraC family transcriptional regulator n=1 Tax=Aromatoleum sp. TaxID=2307007 RepID=UPI002B4A45F4|nr:AraC family transcriptional regulator [Aromatoleum sp.]HJV27907.1 AraC family transcriptional regulator [Aromatoleum sp.]